MNGGHGSKFLRLADASGVSQIAGIGCLDAFEWSKPPLATIG